jgi:3-deoxy-D-manno-octulosonate 8-phosphate phosphatase (KDO 8-P phosphatase)
MPERARAERRAARGAKTPPARNGGGRGAARAAERPRGGSTPTRGAVRILFVDADGTLTDGVIGFMRDTDFRNFYVRDGLALDWARDLGLLPVVISGRASHAVEARLADLKLEGYLGVRDKVAEAKKVLAREGVEFGACAMVGDDLPDVALMKRVGWPIAVADAVPEVLLIARTVTRAPAGRGAVREVVEMLLRHNRTWTRVLERYEAAE